MCNSADTAGMLDVGSQRTFFRCEIVCQDQPLEMKLESIPDFSYSEMCAARGPFCMAFGPILSQPFFSTSSVAAFRDLNSDGRNRADCATSRQAHKISAPQAPHSLVAFLSVRPDAFPEGERCMKDTDHPVVHLSV